MCHCVALESPRTDATGWAARNARPRMITFQVGSPRRPTSHRFSPARATRRRPRPIDSRNASPSVTLDVSGPSDSTALQVTVDGATVASETARLPRKLDPGRHVIVVSAAGFAPMTLNVECRRERRSPPRRGAESGDRRVRRRCESGTGTGVAGEVERGCARLAHLDRVRCRWRGARGRQHRGGHGVRQRWQRQEPLHRLGAPRRPHRVRLAMRRHGRPPRTSVSSSRASVPRSALDFCSGDGRRAQRLRRRA